MSFRSFLNYFLNSLSLFLLCSFIKGLPIKSVSLPDKLKQSIGLQPMQNGISYVISTMVQIFTFFFHNLLKYTPLLFLSGNVTVTELHFLIKMANP